MLDGLVESLVINALFKQLITKDNIVLVGKELVLGKIKPKNNNLLINKILLTIPINIPNNLIPRLRHSHGLTLGPLINRNARNAHPRIQIQNLPILKHLIIHDDKSGQDHIGLPQFEAGEAVGKYADVTDVQGHFVGVVDDDGTGTQLHYEVVAGLQHWGSFGGFF